MRLLFAHAFIGLVLVAIGMSVDAPFQVRPADVRPGMKKGLTEQGTTYHIEISGTWLTDRSGRYHIDSNFREEFSNFRTIDVPVDENSFMTSAHNLTGIRELEIEGHWKIKSLLIDGDAITFQTTSHNDESYVFAGTFRLTSKCSIGAVGIEGRLTKVRDDIVVTSMNAEFHQVCGC